MADNLHISSRLMLTRHSAWRVGSVAQTLWTGRKGQQILAEWTLAQMWRPAQLCSNVFLNTSDADPYLCWPDPDLNFSECLDPQPGPDIFVIPKSAIFVVSFVLKCCVSTCCKIMFVWKLLKTANVGSETDLVPNLSTTTKKLSGSATPQ